MAVKHFFSVLPLCVELFVALRGAVGLEQSRQCAKPYSCRTSLEIPARKRCLQSCNQRERGVIQGGQAGVIKGFQGKQGGKTMERQGRWEASTIKGQSENKGIEIGSKGKKIIANLE